ncbi:Ash-like/host cell division inhibitor Icd-like protein (plasmid) [Klebsiella variicola]|uniref:host cell division inhibitor Icd-like protein n=1 Tax=Klebsiella variicola TaxID=244366 RepID=UPI000C41616A|nr:host cell division inhibitor Icd-like protein [Klebsiella variicola]MBD7771803.1 host cell division inhibitor Icd-like protein [Klebsiella pneumoniae]PHZ96290.1 Ash-like/host cell division inhibitor Icd-like protein [Klebsiella variicola]PIA10581.1 Ash-like/host cell division inhibitor Icd-like protein [Klebsiella variicola]
MILRKSAVQKEAINLAGLLANINPQNLIKPDIHRRAVATNDDILEAFSGLRIGLRILINPKFFSSSATSTREGEFCASIKKGLPTIANPVYGYRAPAESGAGIGVLQLSTAHNRAKCGFFVCVARLHPSMVGWARASKDAPVSVEAGTPTSFSSPPVIGVFGGDFKHHSTEAAAMLATTPTQNPQFIWLIAAVRRDMPTITAKIHHIAAETEKEARRSLARDHVCFFAGRIRTGGAHA